MISAPHARALLAIITALLLSSCLLTSNPVITADPSAAVLKRRFTDQMQDLELATGKRYRGRTIHINAPVPAIYRDWRQMPVAKIRGRRQGGLTSWRASNGHTTVSLAAWRGNTPEWLIRHEALHTILLSHGITGHPSRYASLFGKSYWWMPESYYRQKADTEESQDRKKQGTRPLLRNVFVPKSRGNTAAEGELLEACCPICGLDLEQIAAARAAATSD